MHCTAEFGGVFDGVAQLVVCVTFMGLFLGLRVVLVLRYGLAFAAALTLAVTMGRETCLTRGHQAGSHVLV